MQLWGKALSSLIIFQMSFASVAYPLEPTRSTEPGARLTITAPTNDLDSCTSLLKKACNAACSAGIGFVKLMGWVTGITPVIQTWKTKEKRFFVFFEQPALSILSTPIATFFAKVLWWTASLAGNAPATFPSPFTSTFLNEAADSYLGYNLGNFVRTSLLLDETKPSWIRYWGSIGYSWLIYSLVTNRQILFPMAQNLLSGQPAFGDSVGYLDQVHAINLMLMHALWPFLSQYLGQYIAEYLYKRFPNDKERKKIYATPRNRVELIAIAQENIKTAELKHRAENSRQSEASLKKAYADLKWIEYYLDGIPDDQPISFKRRLGGWGRKQLTCMKFAVLMVALYFMFRWGTIGDQETLKNGGWRPISAAVQKFILQPPTSWPEKAQQDLTDIDNCEAASLNSTAPSCQRAGEMKQDFQEFVDRALAQ